MNQPPLEDLLKGLRLALHVFEKHPHVFDLMVAQMTPAERLELAERARRALDQVRNYNPC